MRKKKHERKNKMSKTPLFDAVIKCGESLIDRTESEMERMAQEPDNKGFMQMFKVLAEVGSIILGPNDIEVIRMKELANNPDLLTEMENNPEAVEEFKKECF
jgi:hypothetical protein